MADPLHSVRSCGKQQWRATLRSMEKSELSAVMRHLNKLRNRKYGKAWRKANAAKAAAARWAAHRD
jgi:hypothetical protein